MRVIHHSLTGLLPILSCLLVVVTGCGDGERPEVERVAEAEVTVIPTPVPAAPLRVVCQPEPVGFLPREAQPVAAEMEIVEEFARTMGRTLELIPAAGYPEMERRLVDGDADLIASRLTATASRRQVLAFAEPHLFTDEVLIVSQQVGQITDLAAITGWEICVRGASAHADTLAEIQRQGVNLTVRELPYHLGTFEALEQVNDGSCVATVADSHFWAAVSSGFPDLVVARTLAEDRPIAIAMRADAGELRHRLNQFLVERALTGRRAHTYTDDLPELRRRGRLRMLTRNNALTYFIYRGRQLGFEYELMRRFARSQQLRLEIAVPPDHGQLADWLLEGRGDVVAAAWAITPRRSERMQFTRPYQQVDHVVAVREDEDGIGSAADLAGRRVYVRASSAYAETLRDLRRQVPRIELVWVPEDMETEQILEKVESGDWDVTVCDSNLLDLERTWGRKLRPACTLRTTQLGWAVRPDNPNLLAALNEYIEQEYRGLHYNMWKKRYFESPKHASRAGDDWRSDVSGRISPFDELTKRHAQRFDLDWRLLTALMYQESRFDPQRTSWAGAVGLLQMLPITGREMGVVDLSNPDEAIFAGARYLRWLIDSLDPELPFAARLRFALAAYNAGRGHVQDARWLARRQGWSHKRWYDNVELAMLLLEDPQHHGRTRFGYCRGSETVRYVHEVEQRYQLYVKHVPEPGELESARQLTASLAPVGIAGWIR